MTRTREAFTVGLPTLLARRIATPAVIDQQRMQRGIRARTFGDIKTNAAVAYLRFEQIPTRRGSELVQDLSDVLYEHATHDIRALLGSVGLSLLSEIIKIAE
ncbi:MAG: hypothetical protein KGJ07_04690 [Patescibacteria group bacterium]|nr:hypothetical protein [Patescibacteria group bacterium]MDE2590260.1 hypothetical protein [Patescibacteria group bacterium]